MQTTSNDWLTVGELIEKYPSILTVGRLRGLLAQRDTNGLGEHVRFLTKRKMVIRESGLFEWIEQRTEGPVRQ